MIRVSKKYILMPTAFLMTVSLLAGCGQKYSTELDCPFTTVDWTADVDDVTALEGDDYTTYDSIYGGDTYSYSCEYDGQEGIIKYMFDDKDKLMCVAWVYSSDDTDDIYNEYDRIHSSLVDEFGESEYSANASTNSGDVWYREEGNVMVMAMVTDSSKAVQYSYINPEASREQKESDTTKEDWNDLESSN